MLCCTQHGANFFFAMGELLLNTIPFVPHLMGFVGFWTSLFGIWGAAAARFTFLQCLGGSTRRLHVRTFANYVGGFALWPTPKCTACPVYLTRAAT